MAAAPAMAAVPGRTVCTTEETMLLLLMLAVMLLS
jgi:hypothetical protein